MTLSFLNGLLADRYLIAGMVAGLLSLAAFAPYIRDTLRGTTQPDRACWLIWAVLASISGASHLVSSVTSDSGGASSLFVAVQVLGTLIVFALSIRFGQGAFFNRRNVAILCIASLGLLSWALMDTAVYALAASIGVSAIGGFATMWKAYRAPHTETASAWVVLAIAAALGVYSVGGVDPMVLAYPLYLLALYAGIVMAQVLGGIAQERALQDAAHAARRLFVPPVNVPQQIAEFVEHAPKPATGAWPISSARQAVRDRNRQAA